MESEPQPLDWHDIETDQVPAETVARPNPSPGRIVTPTSDSACQAERARVLRHPEIAERLTKPPIRYARAEQWSGYVPPAMWREVHNDSPQRKALLEIITAAVEADKEAGL